MKLLITGLFIILFSIGGHSQTTICPTGFICITQAEANIVRDNALELKATKEKVKIQEDALVEKDKSIQQIKDNATKNEEDLKDRLHKTEVELATKTGQLISKEAELTRNLAIIDVLLKSTKKKCLPFSVCLF